MAREPLKATFYAFHRGERRGVLGRAALTHFALLVAVTVIVGVLDVSVIGATNAGTAAGGGPAAQIAATLGTLSAIVGAFIYFIILASFEAACLRWLIRNETKGFGGLSFGGDTWRVWLGQWLWLALSLPILLVAILLVSAFAAYLRAAAIGEAQISWLVLSAWALLVSPLALRLGPGNAVSVGRRKFAYFNAWRATSDRFRALAGSYLIVWAMWALLIVVMFIGLGMTAFVLAGGRQSQASASSVMPVVLLATIVIANLFVTFLLAGVNARVVLVAAREGKIEGVTTPDDVADVFS